MPRPRTWLMIGLGCFGALVLGAVLVVGAGAWFFSRHVSVQTGAQDAAAAVEDVRARFAGQRPLVDPAAEGPAVTAELERRRTSYSGALPERLRLLVWEKRDGTLVRLQFPFWLLRLKRDQFLRLNVDGVALEQLGVTAGDLQAAGPALVLDQARGDTHVLMWTE